MAGNRNPRGKRIQLRPGLKGAQERGKALAKALAKRQKLSVQATSNSLRKHGDMGKVYKRMDVAAGLRAGRAGNRAGLKSGLKGARGAVSKKTLARAGMLGRKLKGTHGTGRNYRRDRRGRFA